jgi:hypothetical protein
VAKGSRPDESCGDIALGEAGEFNFADQDNLIIQGDT